MNETHMVAHIAVNWKEMSIVLSISLILFVFVFAAAIVLSWRFIYGMLKSLDKFEVNEAELGIGRGIVKFRPSYVDRQIAFSIWVELSTRKIGLPIDLDNDVVIEIYDSWYSFFSVTRELVKGISVNKLRNNSTQAIVQLSIEVLNEGLRPHLTRWQARFRGWYKREIARLEREGISTNLDPQQIQKRYPLFEELRTDMERINKNLIAYRHKMKELALVA